jgi:activator of 2-hydroxyglutaryl-CoA dehydratase
MRRAEIIRLAYRPDTRVAASSLLVPPELLWAAGYVPFNLEMFASLLAAEPKVNELANRGSNTTPNCSFFNALRGAHLDGILPRPNVMIASSAYCEGIGYLFEELAQKLHLPHLHIDIPTYGETTAIRVTAERLREIHLGLCELNQIDRSQAELMLRQALVYSNEAKRAYMEMCALRRANPWLDLSLEPLLWHFGFFSSWGDPAGVAICTQLRDEIAELIRQGPPADAPDGLPLALFSIFPYGRTELWRTLLDAGGYSVFEGINWLGDLSLLETSRIARMPMQALYRHLAENLVRSPMRGGEIHNNASRYMEAARGAGARGLLIFSHDQCQMLGPRLGAIEEAASNAKVALCMLDGDCLLGVPSGPAGLRLGTFLTSLATPQPSRFKAAATATSLVPIRMAEDYRIGVDFGSWFSKYVIVEPGNHIVETGTFNSGIDYPALLQRVLDRVPGRQAHQLAIAGVGSDNSQVRSLVDLKTSEINALIVAIRHLYRGMEPLLVVDIGSQDIKVLRFDQLDAPPWCSTNRSCGAGTGCVLSQILERWKQTEPDMTFERLDALATEADRAESLNTTCGIFAVTHVVSALVQSDIKRRKEILKGVYAYIVSQATRHFPRQYRDGGRIVVVGGLAGHRSLREAFENDGYELIPLPDLITSQHVVALGAALSL